MRCNIIRTRREVEAQRATKKPKCRRWFGVVAMLVAFLLIVGSIYLHLRQKSHFGRLHFKQSKSSTNSAEIIATNRNGQIYDYSEIVTAMQGVAADAPQEDTDYNDDYYDTEDKKDEKAGFKPTIIEDTLSIVTAPKSPSTPTTNTRQEQQPQQQQTNKRDQYELNEACLQCICETTTECKPVKCRDGPCGRFRISMPYWTDAALSDMTETDYKSCVNDDACARRVITAYLRKYARDCDGDGIIDCRDYIALHLQGPTGCRNADGLSIIFQTRMESCFMMHDMLV